MAFIIGDKPARAKRIEEEIRRMLEAFKAMEIEKVILFGSGARGDIGPCSDIDLIVVKKTDLPFINRLEEIYSVIEPVIATDILVYTPEEFDMMKSSNPFVMRACAEGRLIYENRSET